MTRFLWLILHGGTALVAETVCCIARATAWFERNRMSRLAGFPAAIMYGCVLVMKGMAWGAGERLVALALAVILLLLFIVLR